MADRTFSAEDSTTAYREAAHWWRSLVGGIDDHQWEHHGLGDWTVRQLVATAPGRCARWSSTRMAR